MDDLRKKCRKSFSDVQFDVQQVIVGAHKFILALGSPVFKRQFYGYFEEAQISDKRTVIKILDSSPQVFRVFIKYFNEEIDISQMDIKFLCNLYYLGDKYFIEELKVGRTLTIQTIEICNSGIH